MSISRRGALLGAGAAAVVAGVPGAALASEDPQLADIQALVSDLRNCDRSTIMAVYVAFQEVADRLETLPGIVPVPNEMWAREKARLAVGGPHHGIPASYLTMGRA